MKNTLLILLTLSLVGCSSAPRVTYLNKAEAPADGIQPTQVYDWGFENSPVGIVTTRILDMLDSPDENAGVIINDDVIELLDLDLIINEKVIE